MRDAIAIIGAGGFIGRHLAELFAAKGAEVLAATRMPAIFKHPNIRNVVAPYDDIEHFGPLVRHAGAVIHAASSSTPGSTAAKPQIEGNLRTTLALIEALQEAPSCRVLFLSSGGTLYGDRQVPAHEQDPLLPRSYHGAGKAAAEHFFHAWATQYDGNVVVLRPSNVYGPGQPARRGFGIIPTAFDCALHNRPLAIWGDGETIRDYLYVDDFTALCALTVARDLGPGTRVFNAASGNAVSLNSLIDRIDAVTGRTLHRDYQPARSVDVRSITADTAAARATFDWSPATSLDDGLARTWQWFTTSA